MVGDRPPSFLNDQFLCVSVCKQAVSTQLLQIVDELIETLKVGREGDNGDERLQKEVGRKCGESQVVKDGGIVDVRAEDKLS